jgi:hypothetical protein
MNSYYSFIFSALEMSVRYGDGNNDDIISYYVHMGLERAKNLSGIAAVQRAHMRVINILIDTMCDHCLASARRKQCYRYIKRLLPLLYEMLNQQQYQHKVQEIETLHAYYLKDNQIKNHPTSTQQYRQPSVKKQS